MPMHIFAAPIVTRSVAWPRTSPDHKRWMVNAFREGGIRPIHFVYNPSLKDMRPTASSLPVQIPPGALVRLNPRILARFATQA